MFKQNIAQDNFEPTSTIVHAPSVVECQESGIVYLGCREDEVNTYLSTLFIFYRCEECWVNGTTEYLPEFEREIVIPDIQYETDVNTWGLDLLIDQERQKHWQISFDEYIFYTTGAIPA
ncbi:MAG: hypothetical protein QNJ54_28775 [Prochloraceae cyanobacterium]|nr:hypothetical protein [Prochloraceae cyanobacterium]